MRKVCLVCALALALAGAECSPYLRLAVIGGKSALNQMEDENIKATEVSCKDEVIAYEFNAIFAVINVKKAAAYVLAS